MKQNVQKEVIFQFVSNMRSWVCNFGFFHSFDDDVSEADPNDIANILKVSTFATTKALESRAHLLRIAMVIFSKGN